MPSHPRPLARFLAVAFAWSWACDAVVFLPAAPKWAAKVAMAAAMWGPGLGALATRQGPLRAAWSSVYALAPSQKRQRRAALALAFALPPLFTLASIALTILLGAGHLKPGHPPLGKELVILVAAGLLGPLVNFPAALGEELGWRGFLAPHLRARWGEARARLATGLIWGFWHAPLLVAGLNYPGHPWLAFPLMLGFTSALNVVLVELAERGGSVTAPTIAHGSLNAFPGIATILLAGVNPCIGAPVGLIAWIPVVVAGLLLARRRTATS
jgi:membrane protease YdiL (CAAX protease family)